MPFILRFLCGNIKLEIEHFYQNPWDCLQTIELIHVVGLFVSNQCVFLLKLNMAIEFEDKKTIVDICYAAVSARRCSWCRPLLLPPCHYQEIIRTILPFIRLFAANGQLLAHTYQYLDCKQGKVICLGSQHVGQSWSRAHNLPFMSPALYR